MVTYKDLKVLYEDNHIIVVEKIPNIPSQGDKTGDVDMLTLIKEYIKVKYNKPGNVYLGLVHRLDRPVGGIMVFARTSKAASRLSKMFNEHKVVKKYLAVINGKMDEEKGTLIDKIERDNSGNSFVSPKGKEAILDYEVLEYNKNEDCSLVSIELKTGRHHQIRVQFASRGHYLLGDQRYGKQDNTQIALFSYYLAFEHPVSKKCMEFKCFPEKENHFKKFLNKLK